EDQVLAGRGLFRLAIAPEFDSCVVGDFVGGCEYGSHRRGSVEGLAAYPVLLDALVVAVRDVVDTRKASNDSHRLVLAHVSTLGADDDPEFGFVFDAFLVGEE